MLESYRKEIDEIDKKIVELFEQRLNFVKKVGDYKKSNKIEIFVPDREIKVLENCFKHSKNSEYEEYIKELFTEIMRISKKVQTK